MKGDLWTFFAASKLLNISLLGLPFVDNINPLYV